MINEKIHKLSLHNSEQIYDTLIENAQRFWQKPNKFIKKALGNFKPSLDLSLLKNCDNDITDDPHEIKSIIINHFSNILSTKNFNLNSSPEWLNHYSPIPLWNNIDCTKNINLNELIETIKQGPNNKAPGENGFTYELFNKLGPIN